MRAFFHSWDGETGESEPLLAILRGAIVNEQASAVLSEFIQLCLLGNAHGLGEDAALRAGLVSAALVGVITSRRIIGVRSIVEADQEKLIAVLTPAIQTLLPGNYILLCPDYQSGVAS